VKLRCNIHQVLTGAAEDAVALSCGAVNEGVSGSTYGIAEQLSNWMTNVSNWMTKVSN
jgi:hypothetical protein